MNTPVRAIDAAAWCASAALLDDFRLYRTGAMFGLRCEHHERGELACTWVRRFASEGLGDIVDIALAHVGEKHG